MNRIKIETPAAKVPYSGMANDEVKMLAARALSVLASKTAPRPAGVERRLQMLCDAFVDAEEAPRHEAILRVCQDGIAPRDVVSHIIPETARLMGQRWADDSLSFAEVTIGAARLQETVRAMVMKDPAHAVDRLGKVLLVVPRPEHHTLGLFVAADRFRRLGYDVDVSVAEPGRRVSDQVLRNRYALVGMTAAGRRTLAYVKELIDIIRHRVPRRTNVVVGGSVLDSNLDIIGLTGADFAAADAKSALQLCGLPLSEGITQVSVAAE